MQFLPRRIYGAMVRFLITCASAFLWAAGAQAGEGDVSSALNSYFEGKPEIAKAKLARLYSENRGAKPTDRLQALTNLLELCVRTRDHQCLVRYSRDLISLLSEFNSATDQLKYDLASKARVYLGYSALYSADKMTIKNHIVGQIVDSPDETSFADANLYIQQKVLAAQIYESLGDRYKARAAADRALSSISSLSNSEDSAYSVAYFISEVISVLLGIKEVERAQSVYVSTSEFIARTLPPLSVEALSFRTVEAELAMELGDLEGARSAIQKAQAILKAVDLADADEQDNAAILANWTGLICTATSDFACARAAMAEHPYRKRFDKARSPEHSFELFYLTARAFIGWATGNPEEVVTTSLSKQISFDVPEAWKAEFELYRLAGHALATSDQQAQALRLASVGRALAKLFTARDTGTFGSWYRPNLMDRLLIGSVLSHWPGIVPDLDPETRFTLMQLAARSERSFEGDAMVALSSVDDEATRNAAHQALRLRARRDRNERAALRKLSARGANPAAATTRLRHDLGQRSYFKDFAWQLESASEAIGKNPAFKAAAQLASLQRVQALLRPDEAGLLVVGSLGGRFASVCVTPTDIRFTLTPVNVDQLKLDTRLLQAALSAEHAASEDLDSQYPAASAFRLYQALIAPSSQCLSSAKHLVWLSGISDVKIPLTALLSEQPPRDSKGYKLQDAAWLIRKFSVTYAASAAAFASSRSGNRRAKRLPFDFLGVGNPLLSGQTADGQSRKSTVLRGVRAGSINDLADLPETEAELKQSALGFENTRLLLSQEASEATLRKQLIGSFRYLSFATHGLLRNELNGLTEPALVLTPTSATNPTNDGLLTASEVADLRLNADLVALSACNTANFDLAHFAADLPALATAFAVAGVPATLATLWKVDSATSQAVVASTFQRVQSKAPSHAADALAEAQRAFIANPASKAHLHPRFWAPFVVIGAEPRRTEPGAGQPAAIGLSSVEQLTNGTEVLGLAQTKRGMVTRFSSETSNGSTGAGLGLQDAKAKPVWTQDNQSIGATEHVMEIGSSFVAGAYSYSEPTGLSAILNYFDPKTGRSKRMWEAPRSSNLETMISSAHAATRGTAYVAVFEGPITRTGPAASQSVHVYEARGSRLPQKLFSFAPDFEVRSNGVHIAAAGSNFLIAYSSAALGTTNILETPDDYDEKLCSSASTRLELRSRNGSVIRSADVPGFTAETISTSSPGRLLIGGNIRSECTNEEKAVLFALGSELNLTEWFRDGSFGASTIRSIAQAPSGRVGLAMHKSARVDYPLSSSPGGVIELPSDEWVDQRGERISAHFILLSKEGRQLDQLVLDAGFDVYLGTLVAKTDGQFLGGGGIGTSAMLFHFEAPAQTSGAAESR